MPTVREWVDEEADRKGYTIRVLDGMDAALIGLDFGGDGPMAVYDEQEVVRCLLAQNPGWSLQEAREWVEVEIRATFQVILVDTPPREEEPEAPTSIRDGLVARLVATVRASQAHRLSSTEGAKAWASGLVGKGPKVGLGLGEMAVEAKRLNLEMDAALAALDDYDRRTK